MFNQDKEGPMGSGKNNNQRLNIFGKLYQFTKLFQRVKSPKEFMVTQASFIYILALDSLSKSYKIKGCYSFVHNKLYTEYEKFNIFSAESKSDKQIIS